MAGVGAGVEDLIGGPIAVVIEAVAVFDQRQDLPDATSPGVVGAAHLTSGGAAANVRRTDRTAVTVLLRIGIALAAQPLVGSAVAVVVEAVTDIRGGKHLVLTTTPDVVVAAGLCAREAKTSVAGFGGTVVAVSFVARFALAVGSVIDGAVAVVVEAVAELRHGELLVLATGPLVLIATELQAAAAEADVLSAHGSFVALHGLTRLALAFVELVGQAVAVVVELIADLFHRCDPADAGLPVPVVVALLCPHFADAATGRFLGAAIAFLARSGEAVTIDAVIYLAAAIIVEAVAELLGRLDLVLTIPPVAVVTAGAGALDAQADPGGTFRALVADIGSTRLTGRSIFRTVATTASNDHRHT